MLNNSNNEYHLHVKFRLVETYRIDSSKGQTSLTDYSQHVYFHSSVNSINTLSVTKAKSHPIINSTLFIIIHKSFSETYVAPVSSSSKPCLTLLSFVFIFKKCTSSYIGYLFRKPLIMLHCQGNKILIF